MATTREEAIIINFLNELMDGPGRVAWPEAVEQAVAKFNVTAKACEEMYDEWVQGD